MITAKKSSKPATAFNIINPLYKIKTYGQRVDILYEFC
jgi:hypothetical protein